MVSSDITTRIVHRFLDDAQRYSQGARDDAWHKVYHCLHIQSLLPFYPIKKAIERTFQSHVMYSAERTLVLALALESLAEYLGYTAHMEVKPFTRTSSHPVVDYMFTVTLEEV